MTAVRRENYKPYIVKNKDYIFSKLDLALTPLFNFMLFPCTNNNNKHMYRKDRVPVCQANKKFQFSAQIKTVRIKFF